jgi:hypothetical protein
LYDIPDSRASPSILESTEDGGRYAQRYFSLVTSENEQALDPITLPR